MRTLQRLDIQPHRPCCHNQQRLRFQSLSNNWSLPLTDQVELRYYYEWEKSWVRSLQQQQRRLRRREVRQQLSWSNQWMPHLIFLVSCSVIIVQCCRTTTDAFLLIPTITTTSSHRPQLDRLSWQWPRICGCKRYQMSNDWKLFKTREPPPPPRRISFLPILLSSSSACCFAETTTMFFPLTIAATTTTTAPARDERPLSIRAWDHRQQLLSPQPPDCLVYSPRRMQHQTKRRNRGILGFQVEEATDSLHEPPDVCSPSCTSSSLKASSSSSQSFSSVDPSSSSYASDFEHQQVPVKSADGSSHKWDDGQGRSSSSVSWSSISSWSSEATNRNAVLETSSPMDEFDENKIRPLSFGNEAPRPTTQMGESKSRRAGAQDDKWTANSLAEWTRTVDLQPLLQRRKAIYKELELGKGVTKAREAAAAASRKKDKESYLMSKEEYISVLKKVFDKSSHSRYSNFEVKQMYAAAKEADQIGDRTLSKRILTELKEVTPRDGRLYRRLARMEKEEGNIVGARQILEEGLQLDPQNSYLWHGLGQMASSNADAMQHYRKAIQFDPSLPMPYHALGTLQHSKGQIAAAMKTLKEGLQYCPSNHRLHHALGDIYRDAKMLTMANKCYRKALKYGPTVSHGFAYTALAYASYEDGDVNSCRFWLKKSVQVNNGRNANGWVSLAQMEEAEGNIDVARKVCIDGISKYEQNLLQRASVQFRHVTPMDKSSSPSSSSSSSDASAIRNRLMTRVPVYRSGDRFFNLYRNWARIEERNGNADSVSEVYRRAFLAFPKQWRLTIDWARYYSRLNLYEQAIQLYSMACSQSAGQHGDPYRCYAEYEMSKGNYERAQEILLRGAVAFSRATGDDDDGVKDRHGMVELYYVWAVCEWHLTNFARAETLFDYALKSLAGGGHDDEDEQQQEQPQPMKCLILYAKARLYHHFRNEPYLAQHCIGLCLKDDVMSLSMKSKVWELWADVAEDLRNDKLSNQCRQLAEMTARGADNTAYNNNSTPSDGGNNEGVVVGNNLPNNNNVWQQQLFVSKSLQGRPELQSQVRRDPWYSKIFGQGGGASARATSYEAVRLPMSFEEQECL